MRCPRCQRASRDDAVFCPGCGAPLALRAEPAPRALDASLSLDRRGGRREPALEPHAAERSASWDLGPSPGAPVTGAPALAPGAVEDCPDDFRFGPLPELADLAREPGAADAGIPDLGLELRTPPPGAPEPALDLPRARTFARALGLAPDPVLPDDLGLEQDGEADAALPGDGDLGRELDLGGEPGGASTPPRPFAGVARDLAVERSRGAPTPPGPRRPLDLALDLGRVALAAQAGGVDGASALDLALHPLPRSGARDLPRPPATPRPRAAAARRRAAAWAIDAAPFVALSAGALVALYGRVPVSPGASASTLELVARDGGAIARPLLACVAVLALVYQTLAHALAGATLGKRILGLRLVGPDGARPTVGRSAARAALSAASVLLLGLGLAPALFTRSGRALHDISSGTRVIEAP